MIYIYVNWDLWSNITHSILLLLITIIGLNFIWSLAATKPPTRSFSFNGTTLHCIFHIWLSIQIAWGICLYSTCVYEPICWVFQWLGASSVCVVLAVPINLLCQWLLYLKWASCPLGNLSLVIWLLGSSYSCSIRSIGACRRCVSGYFVCNAVFVVELYLYKYSKVL